MWRLTVATLTALVLCCVTSARQPHVLVPPRAGSPLHEVFSSGKPPAQYATGGIVWRGQQLAVRWEASDPPPGQLLVRGGEGVLAMVEVYLETERLSAEGGQDGIQLSMCAAAAGTRLPAEPCVTETFRLALKLPRARATWRPRARFAVSAGTLYWFIIQGSAETPATSISWLDGDAVFLSNDTRSAYSASGSAWVMDATNHTLPTLSVSVLPAGTYHVAQDAATAEAFLLDEIHPGSKGATV
mmetsp:Transcript_44393/g.112315  ORF Transcript_44393/g.112315 Transcript_44393/m.112315 type:complete len:243 (+) Transcript_44393:72-800(+)